MSHPDQTLALFNDAAEGVAPELREIERYAAELEISADPPLPEGITQFEDTGYVRVARRNVVALLDVAPVGPNYLPGHAHADTLSFELSLGGRRVIVNGGTSTYATGEQRLRERATAAHSTVQVAGENSSEVWGSFRVGRRAKPAPVSVNGWQICCSHDGYGFIEGSPIHTRCWDFEAHHLTVNDTVSRADLDAVARYIIAPGLRLMTTDARRWALVADGQSPPIAEVEIVRGNAFSEPAQHSPRFGLRVPVDCLAVALVDGVAITRWFWTRDAYPVSN
jgi:uncharacterized heparinase superfamily protein